MDFHGVKMAVTHFVTQVTHVSRHYGVYNKKQKKWLGIIVLKMWSLRFNKKLAYVSPKLILEKSAKTIKKKN